LKKFLVGRRVLVAGSRKGGRRKAPEREEVRIRRGRRFAPTFFSILTSDFSGAAIRNWLRGLWAIVFICFGRQSVAEKLFYE
jgi:hypothetical protein